MVFCEDLNAYNVQKMIEKLEMLQSQFKNSMAIVIGMEDFDAWQDFQLLVSGCPLRLFRASDYKTAVKMTLNYVNVMTNSEKMNNQQTFFSLKREKLCSSETSRQITHSLCSENDTQIIIEGFPVRKVKTCWGHKVISWQVQWLLNQRHRFYRQSLALLPQHWRRWRRTVLQEQTPSKKLDHFSTIKQKTTIYYPVTGTWYQRWSFNNTIVQETHIISTEFDQLLCTYLWDRSRHKKKSRDDK